VLNYYKLILYAIFVITYERNSIKILERSVISRFINVTISR